MSSLPPIASRARLLLTYAAMLAAAVVLYLGIRARGDTLPLPEGTPSAVVGGSTGSHVLAHVLLALATVTFAARLVGGIFRRWLGQPAVIGEIVAGILLGPSLLASAWPRGAEILLPSDAAPYLGVLSKIGVVLFMFLVGMDIDLRVVARRSHATIAISHASIVVPFLLGAAFSLVLYPGYAPGGVSFTAFSLFLGVSMSVTAFPVLARILTDRGVQSTALGTLALACAAVDDVSAWLLLALVTGVIHSQVEGAAWTMVWVVAFVAGMMLFARPLLRWLLARFYFEGEPASRTSLAVVFTALLLSAVVTEAIGIHALFGAFLLGAIIPREGHLREQVRSRLEDVVLVLFLPTFFAYTGMRTQIGLVSSPQDWLVCIAIIALATLGKFGGSYVAARAVGMERRPAAALGLLMNTRGLMELIVLNLGMEMGLISPQLFTMLVLMALVTTFATAPLLNLVLGRRGFEAASVPAEP